MRPQGYLKFSLPNETDWHSGALSKPERDSSPNFWVRPFGGEEIGFRFLATQNDFPESVFESVNPMYEASKPEYLRLVSQAEQRCSKDLKKVVCSRTQFVSANPSDCDAWLMKLRSNFPKAFVYMGQIPGYGHWIGATPEVLVQSKHDHMTTMALAGTKWGEQPFGQKEFDEQQLVTDTILYDLGLTPDEAGARYERTFGDIRHLCTDITFDSTRSIHEIANALHPTPAVCGMPKQNARAFLSEHEGYDRTLYTGYMLIDGIAEARAAFVNLRCAQIFQNGLRFYIGGGINKDSNPESEWEETERKLHVMMNAMQLHD